MLRAALHISGKARPAASPQPSLSEGIVSSASLIAGRSTAAAHCSARPGLSLLMSWIISSTASVPSVVATMMESSPPMAIGPATMHPTAHAHLTNSDRASQPLSGNNPSTCVSLSGSKTGWSKKYTDPSKVKPVSAVQAIEQRSSLRLSAWLIIARPAPSRSNVPPGMRARRSEGMMALKIPTPATEQASSNHHWCRAERICGVVGVAP